MIVKSDEFSLRQKLVLIGLYLSKFNSPGLAKLGFDNFSEAFNVLGYALGSKPASIKNYRDEFDPLFPNDRRGWHKRPTRAYCMDAYNKYGALNVAAFAALVRSFTEYQVKYNELPEEPESSDSSATFAKRLVTGLAAEHYFEKIQPKLPELSKYRLENTTQMGCGYDFKLIPDSGRNFIAVEVKGLMESRGSVSLTTKEHATATSMRASFILFVVKNFRESPSHAIYWDPLSCALRFTESKRIIVHVSWTTKV